MNAKITRTETFSNGRHGWWITITKPNGDTHEGFMRGSEASAKREARARAKRLGATTSIGRIEVA